jgi:hypothetical protein
MTGYLWAVRSIRDGHVPTFFALLMVLFLGGYVTHPATTYAQSEESTARASPVSIDFGADAVSRFVWRGIGFVTSPSIQPSISVQAYGVQVGTWGNYSLTPDGDNAAEHDFWLSYSVGLGASTLTLRAHDYYAPSTSSPFFDWRGAGEGSHRIELSARYVVSPRWPIHVFVARNVHNDPDGAWYVEAGYTTQLSDVTVRWAGGLTPKASTWYGVSHDAITLLNAHLRLEKTVALTDRYSVPLHAAVIVNPYTEQTYLVFGLSL